MSFQRVEFAGQKWPGGHGDAVAGVPSEQKLPGAQVEQFERTRIMLLPKSATNTVPDASTATPEGQAKSAAEPTPLIEPGVVPVVEPPASVVTVPLGEMARILLLTKSATSTVPDASTAMPRGRLKSAAEPTPLIERLRESRGGAQV